MKAFITIKDKEYKVDLDQPIDISIPLRSGKENPNGFFIQDPLIEPFRVGEFTGSIKAGGSCNVNNVFFNPHGNGTHTECVGHISKEPYHIHECLKTFYFEALLISLEPVNMNGDLVITAASVLEKLDKDFPEALIIRTLPNSAEKLTKNYSGKNPPYFEAGLAETLAARGVKHFLTDLPSVDREDDGGKLSFHHAFWAYPNDLRLNATITEFIYVPDNVQDGIYLLNLQIASFMNDASPSKPILYILS